MDKQRRPQKCPVCGEDFSKAVFSRRDVEFHYWNSHTDYPALTKREGKRLVIILTPAVIVLAVTMVYFGPPSFLYATVGYVAFAGTMVLNFGRKIRNFKHRWKEEHGTPF